MARRLTAALAAVASLVLPASIALGQADAVSEVAWFAKANVGFDPFGPGVAVGAGAGAALSIAGSPAEGAVSFYYSPSTDEYTDGGWQYTETEQFFAMTAQLNWLFPTDSAITLVAGTGAIVASVSWEETNFLIADPAITNQDDGAFVASGLLLTAGAGLAITDTIDLRLEVPVIMFFGDPPSFSLPIALSALFTFG